MASVTWRIYTADGTEPTAFAVSEFKRIMKKADPSAQFETAETKEDALLIGLSDGLPVPDVKDPTLDDAVAISVCDAKGYITGSNERSVLIAVYHFFKAIGVAFVRPGRDGEIIPEVDSARICVKLEDAPKSRYRGFCLEGSCGFEHLVDLIDFTPKMGMNIFFTQLWRPTFALARWYGNEKSPSYVPAPLSTEAEISVVEEYSRQIDKRGITHHRMGHGWIPSVLGEKTGIWHGESDPALVNDSNRHLLAEIGGVRKLHNDSAVDTSFCYGNPEARRVIVSEVVKYAKEHPDHTPLHFWLADQPDNQCECPLCRDTRPSDFYVRMLNELDEALSEEGLDTKIIFLSYLELLWAPETERIKNPDRFSLLFAPIRRPYERPFTAQTEGEEIPFIRNGWRNPCEGFSVLNYLKDWQEQFPGDSMLFDYHLMWDFYNDLTGIETGKMLGRDMADLDSLGISGMISCQGVRIGAFGALPMRLMANALWSGVTEPEAETDKFFAELYGEQKDECVRILREVLRALPPDMLRGKQPYTKDHAEVVREARATVKSFMPTLREAAETDDFPRRVSLLQLCELLRFVLRVLDFMELAVLGDSDGARAAWSRVLSAAGEFEALYPKAFDSFEFVLVWHRHIIPLFFDWQINYASGELTM